MCRVQLGTLVCETTHLYHWGRQEITLEIPARFIVFPRRVGRFEDSAEALWWRDEVATEISLLMIPSFQVSCVL